MVFWNLMLCRSGKDTRALEKLCISLRIVSVKVPWSSRQKIFPKYWYLSTKLHRRHIPKTSDIYHAGIE
jgi:hypothetical protein